ncbi:MAG: CDP-alcohol phosphatidyltransferase family protein [Bradymonadia bacterium]|jgi:phosphatidylglycerophosphate synthase
MASFARDIRTVPNLMTLSRIAFIYAAVALYLNGAHLWALIVGTVAGLTDLFDGIVARRTGQVTRLGEVLDQFSDLVFETQAFALYLVCGGEYAFVLLGAYLFREFWVVSIRRFTAEYRINIRSNFLGKLKTNFIGYGSLLVFASLSGQITALDPWMRWLGNVGFFGGVGLGYIAAFDYSRQFIRGYNEVA